MKTRLLLWLLLLCARSAWAQLPVTETFETDGEGTRYTSDAFTTTLANPSTQYFFRTSEPVIVPGQTASSFGGAPLTSKQGSFFWACEGVRGIGSSPTAGRDARAVRLNAIDVSGYTNIRITVAFADPRGSSSSSITRAGDFMKVQYRYGDPNGTFTDAIVFTKDPRPAGSSPDITATYSKWTRLDTYEKLTPAFTDYEAPISAGAGLLYVRVLADYPGSQNEVAFDNIRVTGTGSSVPKPTITSNVGTGTLTFAEGTATPLTIFSDLTVGNPARTSNPTLTGATVTLNGYAGPQDDVTYTLPNGITASSSTTGTAFTLTFSSAGASVTAFETLLESIRYRNTDAINATGGERTFSFVVRDGAVESVPLARVVNVTTALNASSALPRFETFDSDGEGTRYGSNTRTTSSQGFLRLNNAANGSASPGAGYSASTFTNVQGSGYWYSNGSRTILAEREGRVQLAPVNTTGFVNLRFKVRAGTDNNSTSFGSDDYLRFSYSLDGAAWTVFASYTGASGRLRLNGNAANPDLKAALTDLDLAVPAAAAGTSVHFRVETSSTGGEEIVFDDIRITGTSLPTVTTAAPGTITSNGAVLGGNVTNNGGEAVTERGVVYSSSNNMPTIANATKDANGMGDGAFSKAVGGLTPATTYYVRAYATNPAGTSYGSAQSFTTATTVSSIVRASTNPSNAASVPYTVTFGANVTGVTTSNFDIQTTGTISNAAVSSVSGSGTTYTVTVNTGTGTGTLTLRLASANGISPGISTPLPFAGETYTIDKTAPVVSSVAVPANGTYRAGQVLSFTVNFSKAVVVTGTPQLGLTVGTTSRQASYTSGSGTSALTFTYTVQNGDQDTDGIMLASALALNGGTLRDAVGNDAVLTLNSVPSTAGLLADGVAPAVSSSTRQNPSAAVTNATSLTFRVTFSEAVTGVTAGSFTLASAGTTSGILSAVASVGGSGGTQFDVTISNVSGNGTLRLDVNGSGSGITDAAGNALSGGYTSGQVYTLDNTRPTVTISSTAGASGSTTTTTPLPFTATFSESVTGFAASGLTVTNGTVAGFSGSGTTYTFNVTPATPGTATTLSVAANVAQDQAGNGNTAAAPYSLTYTQPATVVTAITRAHPSPTATATVRYQVVFAASVTGVTASNFAVTSSTGASVSSVAGSGTTYTVTVNTGTGNGSLTLSFSNGNNISPSVSNAPFSGEAYAIVKNFAATPQLLVQGAGSASGGPDVTAFVDAFRVLLSGTETAVDGALQNSSFESNNVPTRGFLYSSSVVAAPWTFGTQAGVARNGSDFGAATSINGDAVAFLQSYNGQNGSIAQTLTLPTGTYQVNFGVSQRNSSAKDQVVHVFLRDEAATVFIGSIQPISTTGYQGFLSAPFTVTAPALTATVSTTSASPTTTAPIPFSVSFSQSVGTSFTAADVTVSGGTLTDGSFSGSGSGPYTFSVTPVGPGTVAVSLAANVAQDANNTGNSASNTVSVQYTLPRTAAPVVTAPANGSSTLSNRPTYSGTAAVNSTITVYVDGSSVGTTTADASGNWRLTQPVALASGAHTVYATAQASGQAVSPNSATNNFTVLNPATYASSTADQPTTEPVLPGSSNQAILRVAIVTGGGPDLPLSAQSFTFTTAGTTSPANIAAARVYYTGTTGAFATTTAFGSAVATPSGMFTVTGNQPLATGTNYFWLVYDVAANAPSGNVLDATVPSLTVSGTAYTPSVTNPAGSRRILQTSGVAGTALRFTGDNTAGYADFSASSTPLPVLGTTYSQVAWIKRSGGTGNTNYYVLGNGTGNTAAPFVYITGNGRLGAGYGSAAGVQSTELNSNVIKDNEWNQVAATYNGSLLVVYLNGVAVTSLTPPNNAQARTPASTRVAYVGSAGTTGSNYFPGTIEEVSLWNRALSPTELRQLRHLTLTGTEAGLVSYLQFNDGGATTTEALTGAVGTLTGATRVPSTAPVGAGVSGAQTVTANTSYQFPNTGVSIAFAGVSGTAETVVTRLEGQPLGTQPTATGLQGTYPKAYWIINQYPSGSASFTIANVTYTLTPADISATDAATPSNLKLFKRASNSDGAFDAPIAATAASAVNGTVTFPVSSFSQTVIGTTGTSPLPVQLVHFTAEAREQAALLRWTTVQEQHNDRFEVERSLDGRTFTRIGTVRGAGTSLVARSYTFTDARAAQAGHQVYYRLRQVDTDGTASTSAVQAVSFTATPALALWPNPCTELLSLNLTDFPEPAYTVLITDAVGRTVATHRVEPTAATPVAVDKLPTGTYILHVLGTKTRITRQFVKQ